MTNWDKRFMELAQHISLWSKDRGRKVGSVIVGPNKEIRATGYNGFPRGVNDNIEERHERPEKYNWAEHSERNALFNAARCGVSTEGCALYTTLFPCVECARAIVQCGISTVVTPAPDFSDAKYRESYKKSVSMFQEAAVRVIYFG